MSFSFNNNNKPVYDVMLFGQIDIYPRENYILIIDVSGTKYKFGYFDYDFKPLKGIVDPLMVTKTALNNSVSVASTILSTDCVISNIREE